MIVTALFVLASFFLFLSGLSFGHAISLFLWDATKPMGPYGRFLAVYVLLALALCLLVPVVLS